MSIQHFIFQYIASQITQSVKSEIFKSRPQEQSVRSGERSKERSEGRSGTQLTCGDVEAVQNSGKNSRGNNGENTVEFGFIFAMPMEAVGITDFFRSRKILKAAKRKFTTGILNGIDAVSVISGIGRKNAAEAAESLIDAFHPKRIISAGYSGGLSKRLKPLTVCFPEAAVSEEDLKRIIDLSNTFPQYLPEGETADNKLTLLTVDSAVMSPAAKQELHKKTGAELVDMETFAAAEVCLRRNVPFLSARIISDSAEEVLPDDVQKIAQMFSGDAMFNERGVLSPRLAGSLLSALVKRPSAAAGLYSLKQRTLAATEKLAKYIIRELFR